MALLFFAILFSKRLLTSAVSAFVLPNLYHSLSSTVVIFLVLFVFFNLIALKKKKLIYVSFFFSSLGRAKK